MISIKSWHLADYNKYHFDYIKKKFDIKEPIAKIIASRVFSKESEIDDFMNPLLSRLPAPSLLKDLKKGAERVAEAIIKQEKIAVYGDYDADGITACAVMFLFLKSVGADVAYYIPDRFEDGYSLNEKAILELHSKGINLIITVDCGISDFDLVSFGNNLGIEFIITDHHNPPKKLPPAYAVINPKREDCKFPFKELAGVGVAFYFLIKLRKILRERNFFSSIKEPNLKEYLDLVAIGTVSDMVPLLGPNRIFVKYGIGELKKNKNKKAGVRALLKELDLDNLDARLISFKIAPKLNAPGRMSSPKHAFELLVSSCDDKASSLVEILNNENQRRQKEEEKVMQSALKIIEQLEDMFVYALYSTNWHPGVLGIVASKLTEKYQRPFFIFTDESEGIIKGSARSIDGLPLTEMLDYLSSIILEFGGHDMACGITLPKAKLEEFSIRLNEIAKSYFLKRDVCKICNVDADLDVSDIDEKFFEDLCLLEPFGRGNPEPNFLIKNVTVANSQSVGKRKNHLKLFLKKDNISFCGIGFFMFIENLKEQSKIDLVGIPKINEYNGFRNWDFYIKDFCELD